MITTGIHIPEAVLRRLAASIAEIHRETAGMSIADWRKSYREHPGSTIACFFRVELTATGALKGFYARKIDSTTEKLRSNGFEADVQLLGRADDAARSVAKVCGQFLIQREVTAREEKGHRELVRLTDDELDEAAAELTPLDCIFSGKSDRCGCLSEQLRLRIIEKEKDRRGKESRHQRLFAIGENTDFLAHCTKKLDAEEILASDRRARLEKASHYYFSVPRDFEARSYRDQSVISFRNKMGWQT